MDVHGVCDARFDEVRRLLGASLDAGDDLGASVSLLIEDEVLIDIWGGHADPGRTVPWGRDTITNVWSTTKTMTSLAALVLVDRGELDPDDRVADHWPEFAANGKERHPWSAT